MLVEELRSETEFRRALAEVARRYSRPNADRDEDEADIDALCELITAYENAGYGVGGSCDPLG